MRCTIALGTWTYCQLKDYFILNKERRKGFLQHIIDNEVCALERLTFSQSLLWESVDWARNKCLLAALTYVLIKRVEFRENVWTFSRTKKTDRNNEVSVLSGTRLYNYLAAWLCRFDRQKNVANGKLGCRNHAFNANANVKIKVNSSDRTW